MKQITRRGAVNGTTAVVPVVGLGNRSNLLWPGFQNRLRGARSAARSYVAGPHPRCDFPFVGTDGLQIDGSGTHACVPEPSLHEIKRNAGANRVQAERMAKSLDGRMGSSTDACRHHHRLDQLPGANATPAPEPVVGTRASAGMDDKFADQSVWYGHFPHDDELGALLKRAESNDALRWPKGIRCQRQGLGNAAPGMREGQAEQPQSQRRSGCRRDEAAPFGRVEILSSAGRSVKIQDIVDSVHACVGRIAADGLVDVVHLTVLGILFPPARVQCAR